MAGAATSEPLSYYKGQWIPLSQAQAKETADATAKAKTDAFNTQMAALEAASTSNRTGANYKVAPGGVTSFSKDDATIGALDAARKAASSSSSSSSSSGAAPVKEGLLSNADWDIEKTRMAEIPKIMGSMDPQHVTGGGPSAGDEEAARQAAYARAKEAIGMQTRGAINSLRDQFAGTGNEGAQQEATASVVGGGNTQLGNVSRDQMIMDLERAAAVSDRDYAGNIQQRGQDMSLVPILQGLLSARTALY